MTLGKVIRKYRKIKNLTQEEMAVRLGVTAPRVIGAERIFRVLAKRLNYELKTKFSLAIFLYAARKTKVFWLNR